MPPGSPDGHDETAQDLAMEAKLGCTIGTEPTDEPCGEPSGPQIVRCSAGCQAALERDRCVTKVRRFNKFIDQALAGLPPTAAVLWLTLFRFERNGRAQVSQETLARLLGVDVKTVQRNIQILRKQPATLRILQAGQKGKEPAVYQLGLTPLPSRRKRSRAMKSGSPRKPK